MGGLVACSRAPAKGRMRRAPRTKKRTRRVSPPRSDLASIFDRSLPGKAGAQREHLRGDRVVLCAARSGDCGVLTWPVMKSQPVLLPVAPEIGDEQREARCDRIGAASRDAALAPLADQRREAGIGGGRRAERAARTGRRRGCRREVARADDHTGHRCRNAPASRRASRSDPAAGKFHWPLNRPPCAMPPTVGRRRSRRRRPRRPSAQSNWLRLPAASGGDESETCRHRIVTYAAKPTGPNVPR